MMRCPVWKCTYIKQILPPIWRIVLCYESQRYWTYRDMYHPLDSSPQGHRKAQVCYAHDKLSVQCAFCLPRRSKVSDGTTLHWVVTVLMDANRQAVHYYILVNPSGKEIKWQAVDWCVKLNNLFMKVKNGGKGPNCTLEQILLESPLIQAYWNAQMMIQKNFLHTHFTKIMQCQTWWKPSKDYVLKWVFIPLIL